MPGILQQMLRPRCPRCRQGKLFRDLLSVVDHCDRCALVLKHHDAADGPAFFSLVLVGCVLMGLVTVVERAYAPPLWLHALLWIPLTFILSIASLRALKAVFVTVEYRLALLKDQ